MIDPSDAGIARWTITTLRARTERLALCATVVLGTGACDVMAVLDGNADAENTAGYGALGGRAFISESVTENATPKDLIEGTRISLGFTGPPPPGVGCGSCMPNRVFAHAGCNDIVSHVVVHADRLEFDGVGILTEGGCAPAGHAQDNWLVGFLAAKPAWTVTDSRLTLGNDGTEIVLLDRELANPDRPLVGTTWIVDTIVTGATVSSMQADAKGKAWLRIDGDTFRASSGCGEQVDENVVYPDHLRVEQHAEGNVTVDGEHLRFSATVQTDPACPSELELVDDVMFTILAAEVEFEIDADRLELRHASGVGLGLHADE